MLSSPVHLDQTYRRAVLVGGGIVALVIVGVSLVVGLVSGVEASQMLEAALPTVRFLTASVMTASATTLALLLTLLSLGGTSDKDLDEGFYAKVRQTALLAVVAFIGAAVILTAIVIPFGEQSNISATAYTVLYYVFTGGAALVTGTLVAVVLSLYNTVTGLIEALWLGEGDPEADDSEE